MSTQAKYTDALELAFDQIKAVEARGAQGPEYPLHFHWIMALLWSVLAVALEVRALRQELAKERARYGTVN